MKKIPTNILSHSAIALTLFIVFATIYWLSIPGSFNTISANRIYFDSDGEFITRQFGQGKIFTHNDHLLYHILGKAIFNASDTLTATKDYVTPHKVLSVFFGALGVALFYIFGVLITKRTALPLMCALFTAGTAGWWFFSSTIDTYIPCLTVSIPILGLAALSLTSENKSHSIVIGALAGLAFLFRTDSFLLALMGICFLKSRKKMTYNITTAIAAGIIVALLGYAILSSTYYNIELNPKSIWAWMSGSLNRPESEQVWGLTKNITLRHSSIMFVNQFFFTIVLPGLQRTEGAYFHYHYLKGGCITPLIWVIVFSTALFHFCKTTRIELAKNNSIPLFAGILATLWFFSRLIFYTWWDPFDPFLFSLMATPALWLVVLLGFHYALRNGISKRAEIAHFSLLGLLILAVWLHNIYYMVEPLRNP